MLTIDDILHNIENYGFGSLSPSVPSKDRGILVNMSKLVKTHDYITESQGNLLIKILRENLEHLNFVGPNLITSLKTPTWSKKFKNPEKIRKMSIDVSTSNTPALVVEASYSKELKKSILNLQKNAEGSGQLHAGRQYFFSLTEKNIILVVDGLRKYNFEKSPEILDLYNKIKEINLNDVEDSFNIDTTANEFLKKSLLNDIGIEKINDALYLHDRKLKYQYFFDKNIENLDHNSLVYKIATRKNNKIFVNSTKFTLEDLGTALKTLSRLPLLVILDEYNAKNCVEQLKGIKTLMDSYNFHGNAGVYFRFNNTNDGATFNKLVAEYGYNKKLDNSNKLALLSNGKIPKFFLKTDWYPNSVVTFTNHLRNNKTSVYCNNCDLIVYYTPTEPMIGNVDAIV